MTYRDHFKLVDDVSSHFDHVVASADVFLQSRYVGFFAVTAAAVVELALKDIVISFARRNHPLFGGYIEARYQRANGRVQISDIHGEHLKPLGEPYAKNFNRLLERLDRFYLRQRGVSVKAAYKNLILCRHKYAHEGSVPETMSYLDVQEGYVAAKAVLACLDRVLADRRKPL